MQDRIEQGAETIRGLRRQLRDLLNEFSGRLAQRAGDGREEDEEADGRSQRRWEVQTAPHPGHEGFQKHGHRQRNRHRHDDDRQARDTPQDGHHQAGNDQGAPRERGGHAQGPRDGEGHITFILVFLAHGHHDGGGRRSVSVLCGQRSGKPAHEVG